ncbi:MAG TPA: ribosome assembly RNA-binding protein YhbY [Polyangiaceae bacterium]|jgi:RNA-binding protein|nr:ribosome assembly RNA-binding protein YhbY [Polyangiaceae bacterium]
MADLNSKQRASLRARAHTLNPVVQVGHAGVTEAIVRQVDEALKAHELIKVKVSKESPVTLGEATESISDQTRSAAVQQIGRIMVLFRRNPQKPKIGLSTKATTAARKKASSAATKSGRQLNRNRKKPRQHRPRTGRSSDRGARN